MSQSELTFRTVQNKVVEVSFFTSRSYDDPFREIELNLTFVDNKGAKRRVPAFWSGENTWKARFASPAIGTYSFATDCNDTENTDLNNRRGVIEVGPYTGNNVLYQHGPIKVSNDCKHFEHADGTPFFWLADTWWGGLCERLTWPEDFMLLTDDRVKKGFNVVQIVAGFPPIMGPWDPRSKNEAGYAWEFDFASINPAFFDEADLRIQYLVSRGISPCIFGSWGHTLPPMGIENMKLHWRYIVARWGAYPVTFSLCGESNLPWHLSKKPAEERAQLLVGWTEIGRYLREINTYKRPVTIHVTPHPFSGREGVTDDSVLDFDMLQTGHMAYLALPDMINSIRDSVAKENPRMPVLNGEPTYEGVFSDGWQTYQRFQFWACVLSGTLAGYTYGAAGIWEVTTEDFQAGVAPHGDNWSVTPWREAFQLPGSRQVGLAKHLLVRYPWWRLEPHQEWIEPHWDQDTCPRPFAAGIPGELRLVYMPGILYPRLQIKQLDPGVIYDGYLVNPINGDVYALGKISGDDSGIWTLGVTPVVQDWVIVLEARDFGSGLQEESVEWRPSFPEVWWRGPSLND